MSTPKELKHMHHRADTLGVVIASYRVPVALCEEKQRLSVVYSEAVQVNSVAVNELLHARGKASKQEYDRLRAVRDEARHRLNSARSALEQHKQEHSC